MGTAGYEMIVTEHMAYAGDTVLVSSRSVDFEKKISFAELLLLRFESLSGS